MSSSKKLSKPDACYHLGWSIAHGMTRYLRFWDEMKSWNDDHPVIVLYLEPKAQRHVNVRTWNIHYTFSNGLPTANDGDERTPDVGYVTLPPEYVFNDLENECIKVLNGHWNKTTVGELKKKVQSASIEEAKSPAM